MLIGRRKQWNNYLIMLRERRQKIKLSSPNSKLLIHSLYSNKKIFIELLSKILNLEIKDFYNISIEKFKDISEYEFSLVKINIILRNNIRTVIHLKIVNKDKVKENIFCYWSLIYENELRKKIKKNKKGLLVNKVTITDIDKERYNSSVLLEMQDNPNNILKYGAEVHFVNVPQYTNNKYPVLNKIFNNYSKELLLVGIILNKNIARFNIEF